MPIVFQKFIFRSDLQENPEVLYLFGDNLERKGLGGQAKEMRGEPNAVGIATKKSPSMSTVSFFTNDDFDLFEDHFLADMERVFIALERDFIVIVPADGLGTGLSELPTRAPKINDYIINQIKELRKIYG